MPMLAAALAALLLATGSAAARPVSWPGGWTLIQELDPDTVSVLLHHTPSRHWSVGARLMHLRAEDRSLAGVQATWLVRRWNQPAAQANLYLSGLAGAAREEAGDGRLLWPAGMAEVQADWETRRVMLMGRGRLLASGPSGAEAMLMARAGLAPVLADYGGVHPWLFAELGWRSAGRERWQPALLARVFWRTLLLEAGVTDRGGLLLNSQIRF